MQKWLLTSAILVMSATAVKAQSYEARVRKYVDEFKQLAIEEQKRSGIPASITLAQGIHETGAGSNELAMVANNHFGIKCKKSWTGETFAHTDDAVDECFRKYNNALLSYKDHSDYLSKTPRYAALFTLAPTDYASWATGLRQCGYATNPRYAQLLVKLIEEYDLQQYTYAAMNNGAMNVVMATQKEIIPEHDAPPYADTPVPTVIDVPRHSRIVVGEISDNAPADVQVTYPPYGQIVKVNGLKAVYARKGDIPLEYALKTNVRYERLLEMNDISDRPLAQDMYLYLERKHYKGLRPSHTVQPGETMAGISQYEGVQLKSLRALNMLEATEEPAPGVVLQLQQAVAVKPAIATLAAPPVNTVVAEDIPATPVSIVTPEPEMIPTDPQATPEQTVVEPETIIGSNNETIPVPAQTVASVNIGPEVPVDAIAEPTANVPAEASGNNLPNPPVNIANEVPVEEQIAAEKNTDTAQAPEEPADELDALKARFDKVVYAARPEGKQKDKEKAEEVEKTAPPQEEKPVANAAGTGEKFYTVKKGDTAFGIAKKNNITMRQLMDWNKLDFESIKVGQRLRVKP